MKVLAFFSLLLAVATSYPLVKTWTMTPVSEAIEKYEVDRDLMPYLIEAMDEFMNAMFTGKSEKVLYGVVPSPSGKDTWTLEELTQGIANPKIIPEYKAAMTQAKNFIQRGQETAEVAVPALDISTWYLLDLNAALENPHTPKDLIPYLKKARTELIEARNRGKIQDYIYIVTQIGLVVPKRDDGSVLKPSKRLN